MLCRSVGLVVDSHSGLGPRLRGDDEGNLKEIPSFPRKWESIHRKNTPKSSRPLRGILTITAVVPAKAHAF